MIVRDEWIKKLCNKNARFVLCFVKEETWRQLEVVTTSYLFSVIISIYKKRIPNHFYIPAFPQIYCQRISLTIVY
jgi:hypothetical protein